VKIKPAAAGFLVEVLNSACKLVKLTSFITLSYSKKTENKYFESLFFLWMLKHGRECFWLLLSMNEKIIYEIQWLIGHSIKLYLGGRWECSGLAN